MSVKLSPHEFEALVVEALENIPEPFGSHLDNVEVVIEGEPADEHYEGADRSDELFGLYQGVPQTERDSAYTFVLPDKITIFRGPILRACDSEDEVFEEVQTTVVHEIAHHFGISDDRLTELGWD